MVVICTTNESILVKKKLVPRAQKSKFLKDDKTPPDIHPRNKCAKFQPNRSFLKSPGCPKVFGTYTQTFSDSSSTEVENKSGCSRKSPHFLIVGMKVMIYQKQLAFFTTRFRKSFVYPLCSIETLVFRDIIL